MSDEQPKAKPVAITPEWCIRMAELEGDQEIGAGLIDHRPQPSAEPVAYLYEDKSGYREAVATRVIDGAWRTNGWTETPLYPASALEAARREALAPRGAFAVTETVTGGQWSATLHFGPDAEAMRAFADAVRSALKENPNAG